MHIMKPLYLSQVIALLFSGAVCAQTLPAAPPTELETIEVVGEGESKTPDTTLLKAEDLKRAAAQNIDDLFLYEPGVDVRSNNLQGGHESINIRGMEGNRILMTIDGVPLPDMHADIGPTANAASVTRDTMETDTLRQITVSKGGDAAADGSGSLGGAVAMTTYRPADFVRADKPFYFGLKYGYRSSYRSHGATATVAGQTGPVSGLLMLTRRNLHEAKNHAENDGNGAKRTVSNRQDTENYNILAKGGIGNDTHHVEAVFEQFVRQSDTNRQEKLGTGRSRNGNRLDTPLALAYDEYNRRRFGLTYRYTPSGSWLDSLSAHIDRQTFDVDNDSHQITHSTPPNGGPTRTQETRGHNTFTQHLTGTGVDLSAHAHTGSITHRIRAGLSYRLKEHDRLLSKTVSDTRTGNNAGEQRFFPSYKQHALSLYGEDRLVFNNGAELTFSLRHEREKTRFDIDEAFRQTSNNIPLADSVSHHAWLPGVRFSMPFSKTLTGFAAYSRGYRSPPVDLMASGYDSFRGYRVVPNLDLKPETSHNFETGLRYRSPTLRLDATAFYNRYKDFIATAEKASPAPGYVSEFYFSNLDRAKTYGLELSGGWHITPAWRLNGSVAWMRGKNESLNQPLSTAYPLNGVLGLDYEREQWGVGTRLRWAAARHRVKAGDFRAPGYGVWDLTAHYRPWKNLELHAGIYNIGDKRYWHFADVGGVKADAAVDRYTQPGRNFSLGLHLQF